MPIVPAIVHMLTALGVVCALLATLAVSDGRYELAFVWLGVAFIIDGIDGPLARLFDVKGRLARFSGERLDQVIDYLTYVFVPVLAVLKAGLLPDSIATWLAAGILLSSLYHFSDVDSKADDNSFVGFPAIWNILALYLFVFQLPPWGAAAICCACIGLTFVPWRWVHPMRVVAWRTVTLAALVLWLAVATVAVWIGFDAVPTWAKALLGIVGLYGVCVPALADAKATTPPH